MSMMSHLQKASGKKPRKLTYILEFINVLPVALPAVLAAFGSVAMLMLLIGQFTTWLVWPLGILAAVLALIHVLRNGRTIDYSAGLKETHTFNIITIIAIVLWVAFNVNYNSQNLFVYRDPATYVVTSEWLAHNSDIDIIVPNIYSSNLGVEAESAGYRVVESEPDRLYPHGVYLLPALAGLVSRAMGASAALHTNILIGAVSLLTLYGFARFLVKPRWAFLATACVGLSLPMLYFSRDMYTEPLTMIFVLGSLSLLWVAEKTKAKPWGLWLLSGMTLGAGSLARLDLFIPILAIAAYMYIRILKSESSRKDPILQFIGLSAGVTLTSLLGGLVLFYLSKNTYLHIRSSINSIAVVGALAAAGVSLITFLFYRYRSLWLMVKGLLIRHFTLLVVTCAVLFLAIVLSRPYWHTEGLIYDTKNIGGRQAIVSMPNDGSQIRSENVLMWIIWYLGLPLTLLGIGGIFFATTQARQKTIMLASIFVISSGALVYLVVPSITPDQVWASRRLLPIVIPGIAIYGLFALERILSIEAFTKVKYKAAASAISAIFIISGPIAISRPYLRTATLTNQLDQVRTICHALPERSILLWAGNMRFEALQTTRSYCGIGSMGLTLTDKKTLSGIAKQTSEAELHPIIGLTTADLAPLGFSAENFTEVSTLNNLDIEKTFGYPPKETVTNHRTVLLGRISPDGSVKPLR